MNGLIVLIGEIPKWENLWCGEKKQVLWSVDKGKNSERTKYLHAAAKKDGDDDGVGSTTWGCLADYAQN